MVIKVIRHGKVDFTWEKNYDSKGFDKANDGYDEADIKVIEKNMPVEDELIFVSELQRTTDTANYLFNRRGGYIKTPLLNEVPAKSFKDTDRKLPLWIWKPMSRIQWYFNSKRQPETRKETFHRALKAVDFIESHHSDAYVVCHAIYMKEFVKAFKKKGYKVEGNKAIFFDNLDYFTAKK